MVSFNNISSAVQFLCAPAFSPVAQFKSVQRAVQSIWMLGSAAKLAGLKDSSKPSWLERKLGPVGSKMACLALCIGGMGLIYSQWDTISRLRRLPDYLFPEIFEGFRNLGSQGPLSRWAIDKDPSNALLWVTSNWDHNGALQANMIEILDAVLKKFDLTHLPLKDPNELCKIIERSSELGVSFQNLVIDAHGNQQAIQLTDKSLFFIFNSLPENCFRYLPDSAKIFLRSCSTGAGNFWEMSIAEWLAWSTQRTVIAPNIPILGGSTPLITEGSAGDLQFNPMFTEFRKAYDPENTVTFDPKVPGFGAIVAAKTAFAGLQGAWTAWQLARGTATLLEWSGAAMVWTAEKGQGPMQKLSRKTGIVCPRLGNAIYTGLSTTGKVLNTTGKTVNKTMDIVSDGIWKTGAKVASFSKSLICSGAKMAWAMGKKTV